jgi:ABC-type phosphate/phosphonate transport system substrate-binding protein
MKLKTRNLAVPFMLSSALAFCFSVAAQQTASSSAQQLQSYDLRREVSLVGKVVQYNTASSVAPMGAHVLLQTASGQVDVHIGNAKVLQSSHFELNAGDSVRIVGENLAYNGGTIFAARVVQKGTQAVVVRTDKGALKSVGGSFTPEQTEALRGAR